MSQDYDPIPRTPRAQRMAEAEAIYQLLRLIAKDPDGYLHGQWAPMTGKVTVERTEVDAGNGWKQVTEVGR